ncbi:BTB/POZ domain-containing protein [Actinidia rufa]|uniref:BTB/POZ domain-containing protein n=1 Tax=Actinidia rufa TaxID=165716 RepID=A0A7J0FD00_9ERIC|nr:BTB/POZ domain-containing protein [Actinidia rufa]
MRGHRRRSSSEFGSDSDSAEEGGGGTWPLKCVSCREEYKPCDTSTCHECYEEASETEDELKREIDELKSKVAFCWKKWVFNPKFFRTFWLSSS